MYCALFLTLITYSTLFDFTNADEETDVALFWSSRIWELWLKTYDDITVIPNLARVFALPHLAMFEASNAITGHYRCYSKKIQIDHLDVNPNYDIAISTAIRMSIVHIMPTTVYEMDIAFEQILNRLKEEGVSNESIDAGIWVGQQAFINVLSTRSDDLLDHWREQPVWMKCGDYESTPPDFSRIPGYVPGKTYVLRSADQFLVPPPPAFDSNEFAEDVEEVRTKGALEGSTRTEEENAILEFWQNNLPMSNYITVSIKKLNLPTYQNVRLLAIVYTSLADALLASLANKKIYQWIRPVTAIRNERNCPVSWQVDSSWLPYLVITPDDEEYPSGSAAWAGVTTQSLRLFSENIDEIYPLDVEYFNQTLTYEIVDLETAENEWIYSRVLGGVHYSISIQEGAILGHNIANYVFEHHFLPCKKNGNSKCTFKN
jgi:hypothetical protein